MSPPLIVGNVRFVHARCGVTALSGLQNLADSIYCRFRVGLISVAHQAIMYCHQQSKADYESAFALSFKD